MSCDRLLHLLQLQSQENKNESREVLTENWNNFGAIHATYKSNFTAKDKQPFFSVRKVGILPPLGLAEFNS